MATKNTGMYSVADLLDVRFAQYTIAQFGMDTITEIAQADLTAHNAIVTDLMSSLADVTTDKMRLSGSSLSGEMSEVDEFGLAPTQKASVGQNVGFPMKRFQFNVGWTERWYKRKTVRDWAVVMDSVEKAHLKQIQRQIKKAIFGGTNYAFRDFLSSNLDLPVKAFYNADGTNIPDGPNGEVFNGATHTHYLGSATLTTTAMDALIKTVLEHAFGSKIMVAFSAADEATVRGLSGFVPATDPRLLIAITQTRPEETLDISRLDNRLIGYYGAAEVWVKPWMIQGYAFASDIQNGLKPLAFRQDDTDQTGLYIAAELSDYPLYAQVAQAEFGVGVWNRGNGAVLNFTNASYTAPTIP